MNLSMHRLIVGTALFLAVTLLPFRSPGQARISGDLIIFHAGSLSVPMKEIANEFEKAFPEVNVLLEPSGSVAAARKITELGKPCDILASADYAVIDNLLIPKYADFNIKFASNEMAIVYHDKSRLSGVINAKNWYDILLRKEVAFGRADPNSDPCGYRAIMTLQLAETYYKRPGLAKQIGDKDRQHMRPKEVDLLGLLESNSIDYIFLYKSVAIQHNLKYIALPDQVNLKNPAFAALYATTSVEITGKKPGEKETLKGEPMIYGVTMLRNAPNKAAALAFLEFMLARDKGMKIMEKDGQPSVIPMQTPNYDRVPASLKKFVKK